MANKHQIKPIVVLGSSNTDMVIRVDRIPRPGETVLGGTFAMAAGGKGANQAVAAARAGGKVAFVARVGDDLFGRQALAGFRKEGIRVGQISLDKRAASGVALIFVDRKAENCIGVASGANMRLSPADVRRAAAVISSAGVLLVQLEIPVATVAAVVQLAARQGVPVILNPAPARALPEKILRQVSVLTPNETEAEILTGIAVAGRPAAEKAARRLLRLGVKNVVLTLGARGALIANAEGICLVPAFKVKPVDTTAAGDVFNGALAVALTEGRPLREAVRFANAAAAISVTRPGAQPSAPARREIERLMG
jgi:ribokinase